MLACGNVRLHNIVFHPTSSSLDLFKWEINALNCVYTADKEVRWESEFVEAERLGMLWCGDSATRTHIHVCMQPYRYHCASWGQYKLQFHV